MKNVFFSVVLVILFLSTSTTSLSQCYPTFDSALPALTGECGDTPSAFDIATASSDCCAVSDVNSTLVETGAIESTCNLSTAFGPGQDWALWLPGVNPSNVVWLWDNNGSLEVYGDGNVIISGHVHSAADPSMGFDVFMLLGNARNWDEWSALGRGYKDDLNYGAASHTDWTYYEMTEGFCYLNGTGSIAGSQLQLSHLPVNYYFGYQLGNGANNKNGNEGLSGWFTYAGYLNNEYISGHGDINVDKSCSSSNPECGSTAFTNFWSARNECGYTSFTSQVWEALDTTAPVFEDFETTIPVLCGTENTVTINAMDNCSTFFITYSDEIIEEGCNGLIIRTYTATDACGNSSTATQTIDLFGLGEPEFIVFPENLIVECGTWNDSAQPEIIFEDGCAQTTLNFTDEIIPGNCGGTYTLIRTYTLTDDCDHEVSQQWTVEVIDTTEPELFNIPQSNITLNCGDELPSDNVFAIDNCEGLTNVSLTAETIPSSCGYTFIRTWSTMDGCGNSSSESQTIVYIDNEGPVFTFVPESSVTESCDPSNIQLGDALAEDNCSGATVSFEDVTTTENCTTIIIRTYTAIDGCGNATTASASISYTDTEAPVFNFVPASAVIETCDLEQLDFGNVEVTDNCNDFDVTYEDVIQSEGCSTTATRTYTATDACGNTSTASTTLTLIDSQAPVFTFVPSSATITCGLNTEIPMATATDNCSNVEISFSDVTFGCAGSYTRTYTATDACGNSTTAQITITIQDITGPSLVSGPASVTVSCGETLNGDYPAPVFVDDCSEVSLEIAGVIYSYADCAGDYSVTTVWEATDGCGNKSDYFWTVTYVDDQGPELYGVPENLDLECGQEAPMPEVTCYDVCSDDEPDINYTETEEAIDCGYQITRTWSATDDCGNTSSASQVITYLDTEGPSFNSYPEDITYYCGEQAPQIISPTATDACAGDVEVSVTILPMQAPCAGSEVYLRIYRAFDDCGNSAIYYQTVTVIDNVAPVFVNAESFIEMPCTNYQSVSVEVEDECNEFELLYEDTELIPGCGGIIERLYTAIDACGNTSTFLQVIQLYDNVVPTLYNLPAAQLNINCGDPIPDSFIFAQDNCSGIVPIGLAANTVQTDCGYIFTRTWLAMDDCGNMSQYTQTITAEDQSAPTLSAYPEDITLSCSQDLPPVPQITALDNCAENLTVDFQEETIGLSACATVLRTWCVTDCAGFETCHTQTITFSDLPGVTFKVDPSTFGESLIKWSSTEAQSVAFVLYNMAGQRIADIKQIEAIGGVLYNVPLTTTNLAPGVYVVQANSEAGVYTEKIIVR